MEQTVAGPRVLERLAPGGKAGVYTRFEVQPVAPSFGAFVTGLDLRRPLDEETFVQLERAWREFKLLLFRNQPLEAEHQARLAARFGTPTDDQLVPTADRNPVDCLVVFTRDASTPGLENGWHADGTFRVQPTEGTILRAIEVPPLGGDTLFADMAAAYDNLSEHVHERIDGAVAEHDWSLGAYAAKYGDQLEELRTLVPPVEHPVVLRHPHTGRHTLFVNRFFTKRIVGLPEPESRTLLDHLCRQAEVPEYQVRLRWEPHTIAFWDNLAVQHYGVNDYYPARRTMARATFFGDSAPWQERDNAGFPIRRSGPRSSANRLSARPRSGRTPNRARGRA
jgi:taurine dioxygenase